MDSANFSDRLRLVCLALILVLFFSILVARFYQIQVAESDTWRNIAMRQHYFVVKEPALRGSFYSNTSRKMNHPGVFQKLVYDIEKYHFHVDPQSLPEALKEEISSHLQKLLAIEESAKETFKAQFFRKSRNRKLAMWLSKESQEKILKWWRPFAKQHKIAHNALFFVTDYQRSYPFGSLLGQLLHTVRGQKDGTSSQAMPTGGLELYFNSYLKGTPGVRRLMRSPRNSFETGEVVQAPIKGADIYLTIDHCLQGIVEEELEKGVKRSKAKTGRAVMMDPKTGEILAIAHYPFFDPARYEKYFNDPKLLERTQLGSVTDAWEPGSVMKPITACTAFLANEEMLARGGPPLFDPEEKVPTANGKFPGRSRLLTDVTLHHYLNLSMAIQKSSNIYMARLMEKVVNTLGSPWYRAVLQDRFGFGKRTGIEFPAESSGMLPAIGKRYPSGALEWSTSTPFSLAMGYNLQVNAIQLLRAHSVLANRGILVQPTLVRQIIGTSEDGKEVVLLDHTRADRQQAFPRVLSEKIAEKVVAMMKYTTKPGGSCHRAEVYGYTEVGKSGTSKKVINGVYTDTYRAGFVGFVPVKDPAFVLYVMLDEPSYGYVTGIGRNHHGGTASAPIFAKIAKRALVYLGVDPDDPYGYPNGDPRSDRSKADWVAEAANLQKTYEAWNRKPDK
ncbi:MAG: peptidoglycan D,D-transpeptidase FtsI family protein [Parachlamydiaceae bacterium]